MQEIRILVWFTWFLASNWFRSIAVQSREQILKGVNAMKKVIMLMLPLMLTAGALVLLPTTTLADDDPPGRVARLNYMQGSVSFQASGEADWVEANPNRPLTTGDNLWVDRDSRGEVHVGSTAIRLASETGVSFLNLDDRTVQIQLAQGIIEVHLRHLDAGEAFEVDTPNLAFTLTRVGEFRIKTDPDGNSTIIIVREGEGEVTGGGESWEIRAGGRYVFRGTDELSFESGPAPGMDDFEDWCQERDQRENRALSARYVSRDVDGYYDLDDYGDWGDDPDYGTVWFPRGVAVGWVPYHYGHWVWIAPWGWTWVGDEPWGFAPYHYGRWCFIRGYWGWVPGPIVVRPVYAPHLVAFVGGGGGFSLAVGFGGGLAGVAWFPLGPRDVWVPGYRCSQRYVQNVNVTNTRVVNITQVTNVYNTTVINRNVTVNRINYMYGNRPEAVTAVRREDFVNARPVAQAAVKVTPEQIERARPVEGAEPLAPTRHSYVAASAKPAPPSARPAVPFNDRKVVAKINPPIPPAGGHEPTIVSAEKPTAPSVPPSRGETRPIEAPVRGNVTQQQPPPPSGNKPVEPLPSRTTTYTPPPSRANTEVERERGNIPHQNPPEPQKYEQHPAVKLAPPVKAKDEMYDVHPPLNKNASEPQPQREERRAEPAPKQEQHPQKETKPAKEK